MVCIIELLAALFSTLVDHFKTRACFHVGEIADVILSDAGVDYLSLYPVILLVGEQNFTAENGLTSRLLSALKSTTEELVLQQYHVDTMPSTAWNKIKATGKAKIVAPAAIGKQVRCVAATL